jgi:uncharacterized protein YjdB
MHETRAVVRNTAWQRLSGRAGVTLLVASAALVGCGGGSDVTGTGGGGGGGGGNTAVSSVAVSAPSTTLLVGVADSTTLSTTTATATPEDASGTALSGRAITWSSSATNVATVSSSGVITAVGVGTANIVATSEQKSGQISVTVSRPAVATVTMSSDTATLLVGVVDSTTLGVTAVTATPKDASGHVLTGRTVAWVSQTPAIATVSSTGSVKAESAGASNVTATIEGQVGTTAITVVRPPVTQVNVVPQSSSVKVGATETLAVTLLDSKAHVLTGRLIAAINQSPTLITVSNGQVTGVAAGTATVDFTSEGVTTIATISVTP